MAQCLFFLIAVSQGCSIMIYELGKMITNIHLAVIVNTCRIINTLVKNCQPNMGKTLIKCFINTYLKYTVTARKHYFSNCQARILVVECGAVMILPQK